VTEYVEAFEYVDEDDFEGFDDEDERVEAINRASDRRGFPTTSGSTSAPRSTSAA
jgi:hypothetical protein